MDRLKADRFLAFVSSLLAARFPHLASDITSGPLTSIRIVLLQCQVLAEVVIQDDAKRILRAHGSVQDAIPSSGKMIGIEDRMRFVSTIGTSEQS